MTNYAATDTFGYRLWITSWGAELGLLIAWPGRHSATWSLGPLAVVSSLATEHRLPVAELDAEIERRKGPVT